MDIEQLKKQVAELESKVQDLETKLTNSSDINRKIKEEKLALQEQVKHLQDELAKYEQADAAAAEAKAEAEAKAKYEADVAAAAAALVKKQQADQSTLFNPNGDETTPEEQPDLTPPGEQNPVGDGEQTLEQKSREKRIIDSMVL